MLFSVLSSCTTKNKFIKFGLNHPDIAAEFCADEYPAKDSIIKGKPDTVTNTVTLPPDTIPCPEPKVDPKTGKISPGRVVCPPSKTITKTVFTTDTIIRVDKAKETVLINRFQSEHDQRIKAETERDKLRKDNKALVWACSLIGIAALAMLFFLLRSR